MTSADVVVPPPPTPAQRAAAQLEEGIAVAESIRETCNLARKPNDNPHFAFDSAELSPRGATILDAVGTCLTAGRLAGRSIAIVGYTDPSGPPRYNAELGLARATAAKLELERVGVPADHVFVSSGGEIGAGGIDAQADRRVEIRLLR